MILCFLSALTKFLNIHICVIQNLFHIPCPGCGLTRGFLVIITKGDLVEAFKWNILSVPLFLWFVVSVIWIIVDIIRKQETLISFISKKMNPYFYLSLGIVVIITWIINLNNPLLY